MSQRSRVVLVGDSVFDNAAYVTGPDVRTLVEIKLPAGWSVFLLAVDGSFILDVPTQLHQLPDEAKFVVVRVGGNDALRQVDLLGNPVGLVGEALLLLEGVVDQFRADYSQLSDAVLASGVSRTFAPSTNPISPTRGSSGLLRLRWNCSMT